MILKALLTDRRDLREVFVALFPGGLATFSPARTPDGARKIWRISGSADFSSLMDHSGPVCVATPTGFEPRSALPRTLTLSRACSNHTWLRGSVSRVRTASDALFRAVVSATCQQEMATYHPSAPRSRGDAVPRPTPRRRRAGSCRRL